MKRLDTAERRQLLYETLRSGKYWVDWDGTVWSLVFDGPNCGRPYQKKTRIAHNGYRLITLVTDNSRPVTASLHQIVWLYFHGMYPEPLQINHIDGNKQNNAIDNLELVTPSQNIRHSVGLGIQRVAHQYGESNTSAKLSNAKVIWLRQEREKGRWYKDIAKDLGVTVGAVRDANIRRTWAHVR